MRVPSCSTGTRFEFFLFWLEGRKFILMRMTAWSGFHTVLMIALFQESLCMTVSVEEAPLL